MATTVRIALAQIHYMPAYVTPNNDYLDEPAPPVFDGNEAPIAGRIRTARGIAAAIDDIRRSHIADLEAKATAILQYAMLQKADVLVFPEYSIPPEILPTLYRLTATGSTTVIAGTHSVRATDAVRRAYEICRLTELSNSATRHARKAVVPVLRPDGSSEFRFKKSRSKWEHDLIVDPSAADPVALQVGGRTVELHLRVCIDALNQTVPIGGGKLLVVTALTPPSDMFDDLFAHAIARDVASAIANTATYGGTAVVTRQLQNPSDFSELQSIAADEGVLVVDVDVDAQFGKAGSVVTDLPATIIARAPILYQRATEHAQAIEQMERFSDLDNPQLVAFAGKYSESTRMPSTLRENFTKLQFGLAAGTLNEDEIEMLLAFVKVPDSCLPFSNRCVQALELIGAAIGAVIVADVGNESAIAAVQRIPALLRSHQARSLDLVAAAPSIGRTIIVAKAPFVDRERERDSLRRYLETDSLVAIQGLPGIGKRALVSNVCAELFPNTQQLHVHCVAGMNLDALVRSIETRLGLSSSALEELAPSVKAGFTRLIVIHDAHHPFEAQGSKFAFDSLTASLQGSGVRLLVLSERRLPQGIRTVDLRALPLPDTRRLLEYYSRAFGVSPPPNLAEEVHGYPQAAIFACDLLRTGGAKPIEQIKFFGEIRREILETILRGMSLDRGEQDVLLALATMRRPFSADLLSMMPFPEGTDVPAILAILERRFLIEQDASAIVVPEFVRETAMKEWSAGRNLIPYHRAAAKFFDLKLASNDVVERFDALEESIYHETMAGNYQRARQLGENWIIEARAAMLELNRRRINDRIVDLADAVRSANINPELLRFFEGFAVTSLARQRRFGDARRRLDYLRTLGDVDPRVLTIYGESLFSQGAPSEALELLDEAYRLDGANGYPLAVIAEIYVDQNKLDEAEDIIEMALEKSPDNVRVLDAASRVARLKGDIEQAYKLSKRAMSFNPRRAEQNFNKARSAVRKRYGGTIPPTLDKP